MPKEQPKKRKRGRPRKVRFEDKYDIIDAQIKRRRGKWYLNAISWLSWEDVEQIIRTHIYKKWKLWDQKRALEPWLNRIISNQIKNILRNYYSNFIRPCSNCPFNLSGGIDHHSEENYCSWTKTGKQDSTCPLYAKWEKSKKNAYNINMATNIDDCLPQITKPAGSIEFDIERSRDKLNILMKKYLNTKQYVVYDMLYIQHLNAEEVAKKLGYKSNERGRKAGYKQIKNFEKIFKELAKKIISEEDIV